MTSTRLLSAPSVLVAASLLLLTPGTVELLLVELLLRTWLGEEVKVKIEKGLIVIFMVRSPDMRSAFELDLLDQKYACFDASRQGKHDLN